MLSGAMYCCFVGGPNDPSPVVCISFAAAFGACLSGNPNFARTVGCLRVNCCKVDCVMKSCQIMV